MIVLPSCSHTAISAQPGVQRIGEPKMLLNQFICTESPVLVQWYSAGCRCMVSPTPGKMASPSPSPSCDVVRWPGAARAGLHHPHHTQCPQLLQTQPGGHLQSRHVDTCPDIVPPLLQSVSTQMNTTVKVKESPVVITVY